MNDLDAIKSVVIIAMLLFMLVGLIGGLWQRVRLEKGITHRFIQLVGVCWLVGATVILATFGTLNGAAATILGALAGYVFALQRHDGQKKKPDGQSK